MQQPITVGNGNCWLWLKQSRARACRPSGLQSIACGYTDLRKGIDGLARLIQQQFALDPFTNTLFLFCGRRRDRIKGLYWEKDGFILLYKRLEQGAYQWPRFESEVKVLTPQQ